MNTVRAITGEAGQNRERLMLEEDRTRGRKIIIAKKREKGRKRLLGGRH